MDQECASLSLKNRIKSSICCFRTLDSKQEAVEYEDDYARQQRTPRTPRSPMSPRSPYSWFKDLEIKDSRRRLLSKIGSKHRPRHHSSSDFSYDAMSYSLNFEDDISRGDDEFRVTFSSRLPASPDRSPEAPIVKREIVCL